MAELAVLPVEVENKKTTGGRTPGSPYLSVKAVTQEGIRRTLVVFEESLFQSVQDAFLDKYPIKVRTGDTDNSTNQVKDVLGKAEPLPEPSTVGGSAGAHQPARTDYYQFKPMNPDDRRFDLRKNALNNASAVALERMRQTPGTVSYEPSAIADFTLRIAEMYYEWFIQPDSVADNDEE